MSRYVAFVRGINVGGVVLKMEDLRHILEYVGFSGVLKWAANRWASIVAEVMITLRSGRLGKSRFK